MSTQSRFSRRMGEQRPCDAEAAIALHAYKTPALRRFFYACLDWGWVAALAAVLLLTGCDDMAAAHAAAVHAAEAQGTTSAELQARAEQRRALAASEICKGAAHEWDGSVLTCHRER